MIKFRKIGILALFGLLCVNTACEVEGRNSSTSSINSIVSNNTSSVISSSKTSSTSSSTTLISTGLPQVSQEFIDAVNSIVVDINAGEAIENAYLLFEALPGDTWDYPEVLEAYNRLWEYEEQYILLKSNREKIDLFLEKVVALPEVITLEDEYLIVRAEDSYQKLDEELKNDTEVIVAYEKMVNARENYDILYNEAMAEKNAADIATFLELYNNILATGELSYARYLAIEDALEMYETLSDVAKAAEGIPEAIADIQNMKNNLQITNGTHLFDIEIVHSGVAWEAILNIQAKDEQHKVTGTNKVQEFRLEQGGVRFVTAGIRAWGEAPYAYSYTKSSGVHSFAFTTGTYYNDATFFNMSFLIKTDAAESYAISIAFYYEGAKTYVGVNEDEISITMFKEQLALTLSTLIEADYTEENWLAIQNMYQTAITEIDESINIEHARMIFNQYNAGMRQIEKKYTLLEGMTIVDFSSNNTTYPLDNIFDGNTGTRWQAATTANTEYIVIDLGQIVSVAGLSIMWEAANASNYSIQISNENANWDEKDVAINFTNGADGNRTDEVRFAEGTEGRYIRINFLKANMSYGYSIYEIYCYQDA